MIKSMTAYARHEHSDEHGVFVWEVRSVNHRYLEPSIRMPEELRGLEQSIRDKIAHKLKRGKIECMLRYKPAAQVNANFELNEEVARSVIAACDQLGKMLGSSQPLNSLELLRWPGVTQELEKDTAPLQSMVVALLGETLTDLIETREREGTRIHEMLTERCKKIAKIVSKVRTRRPQVQQALREKIQARLQELSGEPDQSRLEQELVYLAQKMDVDEELDRLDTHIGEIIDVLNRDEAVGRRLDFLMQELNREANTLSSKSNDIETTQAAVDLKVLIEQMREQVQNVE